MKDQIARVRTWTLAREEIRALPRNTFALGALAVVLGLLAPLVAIGLSGGNALRELLFFTWLVGELLVGIVVAARVASPRRTRFVESLFTTPIEPRTWLAAQALVGVFLAAAVLLPAAGFVAVHLALVGVPPVLPALAVAALAMGAFAVVLGLFCGVIVGDRGSGAAAGLAGGVGFLAFVLFLVHGIAVTMPPMPLQPILARATALSPLALATDAAGVTLFRRTPESWARPLVGLLALVGGLGAAATVAYLRAQGPLGWERRPGRGLVAALVAAAILVPVAAAETEFREERVRPNYVFEPGERVQVAFVAAGAPVTGAAFTVDGLFDREPLRLGEVAALDALVLLVPPEGAEIQHLAVDVQADEDVVVLSGGALDAATPTLAGSARPGGGTSGPAMPVVRVPLTVRPVHADALLGSSAVLSVEVSFSAGGRAYTSEARGTVWVDVPGATPFLFVAGLPAPLAAAGALVARKVRTR